MTLKFNCRRSVAITLLACCLIVFFTFWQYFSSKRESFQFHDISRPYPEPSTWLAATIQPASAIGRRMIIRLTWQRLYKDVTVTTRFVLADPGPFWAPLVEAENATYGDIVVLRYLEESSAISNSIKTIEFFKWLTAQSRRYLFVSKVDDDSFINAREFYDSYLAPRMEILAGSKQLKASAHRTALGRRLSIEDFDYPGGQFYTITWDLLELLVKLQQRLNVTNLPEDVLIGHLLREGNEKWNLVELSNPVAFDYSDEDIQQGSAWAANSNKQEDWIHAVGPKAINPHRMKEDITYLRVSDCFDEGGLKSYDWTF